MPRRRPTSSTAQASDHRRVPVRWSSRFAGTASTLQPTAVPPRPWRPRLLASASVITREATGEEITTVADCYEWLFEPPGMRPPQWDRDAAVARLHDACASDRSTVLIAEADGQIVGICTAYLDIVSVRFGQRCWVEDLAVHPEWRSHGVGANLMDAVEYWAREHGASHVELDSSDLRARAHRFYERRRPSWTSRCFGWVLT